MSACSFRFFFFSRRRDFLQAVRSFSSCSSMINSASISSALRRVVSIRAHTGGVNQVVIEEALTRFLAIHVVAIERRGEVSYNLVMPVSAPCSAVLCPSGANVRAE